jgi:hypothetical protein
MALRLALLLLPLVLFFVNPTLYSNQTYDLVIKNANVVELDGSVKTGFAIGVSDGRITYKGPAGGVEFIKGRLAALSLSATMDVSWSTRKAVSCCRAFKMPTLIRCREARDFFACK